MPVLAFAAGACGAAPEEHSGEDAYRHQAAEIKFDEWDNGDISVSHGDKTDWKTINFESPGTYRVLFHATEKKAAVRISVMDRYGRPIAGGMREAGSEKIVNVLMSTPNAGKHFIMVQGVDGPRTDYAVKVTGRDGSAGTGNVPRPQW